MVRSDCARSTEKTLRVSQSNHDPDFNLAEESHQVVITLLILVRMISKSIKIYTEFTMK
jgi:hypothetical protein